jgi:hypothetical protein
MAGLPEEWKSQMDFFKELDSYDSLKTTSLRKGKTLEKEQFDSLIREVELDQESASRSPRKVERESATLVVEEDAPALAAE